MSLLLGLGGWDHSLLWLGLLRRRRFLFIHRHDFIAHDVCLCSGFFDIRFVFSDWGIDERWGSLSSAYLIGVS
jgi:hypothetical protein